MNKIWMFTLGLFVALASTVAQSQELKNECEETFGLNATKVRSIMLEAPEEKESKPEGTEKEKEEEITGEGTFRHGQFDDTIIAKNASLECYTELKKGARFVIFNNLKELPKECSFISGLVPSFHDTPKSSNCLCKKDGCVISVPEKKKRSRGYRYKQ